LLLQASGLEAWMDLTGSIPAHVDLSRKLNYVPALLSHM